jgi:hypothetical protein
MNKVTLLPATLADHIEQIVFPSGKYDFKNKSILLLKLIYSHYLNTSSHYCDLSCKYLQKTLGKRYYRITSFLIEQNLIETYKFQTIKGEKEYSTRYHQSKRYRIIPNVCSPLEGFKKVYFKEKEKEDSEPCIYSDWSKNDLGQTTLNKSGAKSCALNLINEISINDFFINEAITQDTIHLIINDKTVYLKRSEAIERANSQNKDLIQVHRNKFVIDDRKNFIAKKKEYLNNYYSMVVAKIENQMFFSKRNKTNKRLDTNITSLPSELIKFITVGGERLINIDFSNSQFAFLAWRLQNYEVSNYFKNLSFEDNLNLNKFIALAQKGVLYDETADLLNIDRRSAKDTWFQVAFSSHKFSSPEKRKLEEKFPVVFQWIKNYKKECGDKEFSIMLQKTESAVCIDRIYKRIKEAGYFCLTKHDSFLVKESQVNIIENIVREELDRIGMVCNLKIDSEKKDLIDMEQLMVA